MIIDIHIHDTDGKVQHNTVLCFLFISHDPNPVNLGT
jgi:hypothetical protein